jgi:hypothetical protein
VVNKFIDVFVKKSVLFFLLICIFFQKGFSQNQLTDQTFFMPNQSILALNPSFAGSNGAVRNQSAYTKLNYDSTKSFAFYNGLDFFIKKTGSGIAFSFLSNTPDKLTKHKELNLIYAQHFSFYKGKLKVIPSFQTSYFNDINANKVFKNEDSISVSVITPWSNENVTKIDFSTGLLLNYKSFYVGMSIFHINRFDINAKKISDLQTRYCFNTSYNMHVYKNLLLNLMIRAYLQEKYYSLETTLNAVFYKHVMISANNSIDRRIFTSIGYRHHFFTATVGYSFPVKKVVGVFKLIEFALSYNLRNKEQRKTLTDIERW